MTVTFDLLIYSSVRTPPSPANIEKPLRKFAGSLLSFAQPMMWMENTLRQITGSFRE